MLRNSFTIIALLISLVMRAEVSDPIGVFQEANTLYENQQYDEAKEQYQTLLNAELYSSELYQNLGNTYYKLDDIPSAILYFEKALKLSPGDDNIMHNLQLCNKKVADKNTQMKSVRLDDWFFSFISHSPNYWALSSIFLFVIGFGLLILYLFAGSTKLKKLSFYSGLTAVLLGIISIGFAGFHKAKLTAEEAAIIFKPSIELMNEPSENSSVAFVLHEGSKVTLLNQNENWYEVKFGDGKIGWLQKEFVKVI